MDIVTQKSEEQIAKDRDAVRAMVGAKTAMEAALRRIDLLESRLKSVRDDCGYVAKALGDAAHFRIWHQSDWRVRSAKEIFNDIDNAIKAVL